MKNRVCGFFLRFVESLSRLHKQVALLLIDVVLAPVSLGLAIMFVFPVMQAHMVFQSAVVGNLLVIVVTAGCSILLGVPNIKLKSYEAIGAMKSAVIAIVAAMILLLLRGQLRFDLPISGIVLFVLIFLFLMVSSRIVLLNMYLSILRVGKVRRNVIIYGAGNTGAQLAAALRGHETIRVTAFVDDAENMQGLTVRGLTVHDPKKIDRIAARYDVAHVLLAMPSASPSRHSAIARNLMTKGLEVQALPSFAQLVGAEALVDTLELVAPGSFLGRAQLVELQPQAIAAYNGKCIMVTGAGGSVGSELCRQLLRYSPAKIVLFEISEIALYTIDREFAEHSGLKGIQIVPVLGSISDSQLTRAVIVQHSVDVILHAAAYKHVPLVEANPIAGVVNNVLGTRAIAESAFQEGVKRFILISTAKAVRPTNVMGASKRMAELVVQDMALKSDRTDFSIVRFGNVLGSSGSVIPLFKRQIAKGGPVTLTHDDVTRYFMTIAEAASLVLIAGGLPEAHSHRGGDLMVLDMGNPIRIRDLAELMIKTAGFSVRSPENPNGDIEIKVMGLRAGEKLHEELLIEPGMLTTPHDKILRVQEKGLTPNQMASALHDLRNAVAMGDTRATLSVLESCVEGYNSVWAANAKSVGRPDPVNGCITRRTLFRPSKPIMQNRPIRSLAGKNASR